MEEKVEIVSMDVFSKPPQEETKEVNILEGLKPLESEDEKPEEVSPDKKKPIEVEEEVSEPIISAPITTNNLRNIAKKILGGEGTIIQSDENGEEVETSIDEVDLTEEMVEQLLEARLQQINEEASKDKVSISGVNETGRALINIIAKGGDVSKLLEVQTNYVDPMSKLDLTVEADQMEAIRLRYLAAGDSEEDIDIRIEGLKTKGILEERAEKAFEELNKAITAEALKKEKEAEDLIIAQKEKLKSYTKDLGKKVESTFELADKARTKLVNFASKPIADGDMKGRYEMDVEYHKQRVNPDTAADLALFLYDKALYLQQATKEIVQAEKIKTSKKLRIGSFGSNSQAQIMTEAEKINKGTVPLSVFG